VPLDTLLDSGRGDAAPLGLAAVWQADARAGADAVAVVCGRFGRVIRQLREARGWSQERLAGRAELNRSYMGEIERLAAMPSLATASKLALALDVPLSELITRCEEPSTY
jgi:ribosome-binding protein aMBF1 (putative translation factor)